MNNQEETSKNEQQDAVVLIPPLLESEIPNNLSEMPKCSITDEADPLEDQNQISENRKCNKKIKPAGGVLTTNAEKFEYAQAIVKEVMRRVPIFTQNEQDEKMTADKLRIRMMRIKNRIINDIKLPLEEQEVAREKAKIKRNRKYQRMMAKLTPEEAALRRKREAEAKCYYRHIQKELETPDLLLERKNEKLKRRQERKTNETPEERAARKEQGRQYRQMLKERRAKRELAPKPNKAVCAKTGIVYDRNMKKRKRKTSEIEHAVNVSQPAALNQ